MILVTGASGTMGRAVLDAVSKTGKPVRAMYRRESESHKAPVGVSTVIGDFDSKDSLRNALSGVDVVFLVCSPIPALVELESNVIDASRESGVRHIVLNSALGAEDYPKSFPGWHRKVEDKLKASDWDTRSCGQIVLCKISWHTTRRAFALRACFMRPWATPKLAISTCVILLS
jgi:Predicted nucleoside-diphosphate-sugar epimerases